MALFSNSSAGLFGGRKSVADNTTSIQDLLDKINGTTTRLDQNNLAPIAQATATPQAGILQKVGNILSTGQKEGANAVNDIMTTGKLPSWNEVTQMADPNKSYSYKEVLKNMGMGEGLGRTVLGTAMDIGLDPINFLPLEKLFGIAGKVAGPVADLAEKIPGIGKGVTLARTALEKIGTLANQARNITPYESEALNNIHTVLSGGASRQGDIVNELMKTYPEAFKGISNLSPERFDLINQAVELPKMRGLLTTEEKAWLTPWRDLLKATGQQKLEMGTVKGLIGTAEAGGTVAGAQLALPGMETSKDLGLNMAEQMSYDPHIMTPEFRTYMRQQSGSPEDLKNVMSGMIKKFLPKTEASRTFMGTINAANDASMKEIGMKVFEDNPGKIVQAYTQSFAKQKSLWDMQKEIMTIKDDAGNPLIKPMTSSVPDKGMVEMTGLPYKGGFQADPEVAKMINRVNGVFASDEFTNKFLKAYDSALKTFKYSITMPWPTFNMNNLMGAEFNNFIADASSMLKLPQAMKMMKDIPFMIESKVGPTITSNEFKTAMSHFGAFNTFANAETGAKDLSAFGKLGKSLSQSKLIQGYAVNLPNNIETLVRTQLGLAEYEKTGSLMKAARKIWEVHGNYTPEFLSPFEKNVMTRMIPFWRWVRTSVPFQLEQMYKQTGKYAALAKVENSIISPEDRAKLPSYLQNQPITGTQGSGDNQTVFTANLPFLDVSSLKPSELAQRLSPAIKLPLEMLFNKQLFTGQPIADESLPPSMQTVKANSWMQNIPILNKLLGVQTTAKLNKQTGQWEPRTEANAKAMYLLNNLGPITSLYSAGKKTEAFNQAAGINTKDIGSIPEAIKNALLGVASPIKPYNYNPSDQAYQNAQTQTAQLQAIVNYLLQRNMIPKKTTKKASSLFQ